MSVVYKMSFDIKCLLYINVYMHVMKVEAG
jgi:hypothetical protein